jgi:hypothetical protein
MLSFAYVYFLESGLFNGLQPIQIKKSFPVSRCVSNVIGAPFASPLSPRAASTGSSNRNINSTHSGLRKENACQNFAAALHERVFSFDAKGVAPLCPEPYFSTVIRRL